MEAVAGERRNLVIRNASGGEDQFIYIYTSNLFTKELFFEGTIAEASSLRVTAE
jgi:hypothetical protein